jgi:hypothetical protein
VGIRYAALRLAFVTILLVPVSALSFEDTRVLPSGVRSFRLIGITSDITQKTDANGVEAPLAKPIEKPLTFKDVLKGESTPLRASLARGYLEYAGFSESDSVGRFDGDVRSRLTVFVPAAMVGVSDRLTLAAALPIVNASVAVDLAFRPNGTGQRFLNSLSETYNNQTALAREAGEKMNGAVGELNRTLRDNGYRSVSDWHATGPGDLNLVAKYRLFSMRAVSGAISGLVVAPTGRRDDPNNLMDRGFGDGQWDAGAGFALDEPLVTSLTASQFVKYTVQLPGEKEARMVRADEPIEVPVRSVRFKPGNKLESGVALQYAASTGVGLGVGYTFYQKGADTYWAGRSSSELEKGTNEESHEASIELGYNSIQAFLRKEFALPFDSKFVYKHQLASVNMPVTHFLQVETALFF